MKKILLLLVLMFGIVFTTTQIGAKMNTDFQEVRALHILVGSEEEAKNLKNKITSGEVDFETAAAQYSSCPSGARGGDLGYFPRGVMVKEFEVAAFDGEKGEVTEPVKTQFGWHLIKVVDKK
jgi:peptidyl-prolyl cis-trans isomerase C